VENLLECSVNFEWQQLKYFRVAKYQYKFISRGSKIELREKRSSVWGLGSQRGLAAEVEPPKASKPNLGGEGVFKINDRKQKSKI